MNSFLEFLSIAPQQQQKALLMAITDKQLKLLIEILYNVAMDTVPISDGDKKKLSKYKLDIRKTLADGLSTTLRRRRLIAISGVLPVFIKNYSRWLEN